MAAGADRATAAALLAQMQREAQAELDRAAPAMAGQFVRETDRAQKEKMTAAIRASLGVDFAQIIDSPAIGGALDMAVAENVDLIKSISSEHFSKVRAAVMANYSGQAQIGDVSLTERLQEIGQISKNKAALIARDQTSKLIGGLNQIRMADNGIESYRWRTARDQRVVGTPGGLYPEGNRMHGNHYAREGKPYRWDTPPADGHPGAAINCRCYAEPILDLAKLKAQYV